MSDLLLVRQQAVANQIKAIIGDPRPMDQHRKETLTALLGEAEWLRPAIEDKYERRKGDAFSTWLRTGAYGASDLIERADAVRFQLRDMGETGLGTGVATGAGATVPISFSAMVDESMALTGPLVDPDLVTIETLPNARNIARPSDSDLIEGELVPENAQTTVKEIHTIGQTVMRSYKIGSGLIVVSNELLNDSGFPFAPYLARKFGLRLGRTMNRLFTNGLGLPSEPLGLVNQIVTQGNVIQSTGGTGGLPPQPYPSDFTALELNINQIYLRKNGSVQVSPLLLSYMRNAVDTVGNPLFKQLHVENVQTDYFAGYPLYVNPALDPPQTTASSPVVTRNIAVMGDLKQFRVRKTPLLVFQLRERFADRDCTGFVAWTRVDCALTDGGGGAVKVLQSTY